MFCYWFVIKFGVFFDFRKERGRWLLYNKMSILYVCLGFSAVLASRL